MNTNGKICFMEGCISRAEIESDAAVIIEIPKNDIHISPQHELIENDPDLERQTRIVMSAGRKAVIRSSRTNDRLYLFIKTDSAEDFPESLNSLKEVLSGIDLRDRKVYAERIGSDASDEMTKFITQIECKQAVYFYREAKEEKVQRKFNIDFTPAEFLKYLKNRIRGQDKAIEKCAMYVMDFIEKASLGNKKAALNWMLTAPSGMGKTEFFRAVRDYFSEKNIPVPVVQIDLSSITETGFKGRDADCIAEIILAEKSDCDGTAICFLDESDKKFMPSYGTRGQNINELVQGNLLTIIEGCKITNDDTVFDTSRTMFVFLGAFQKLRDRKKLESDELSEIFGENGTEDAQKKFYENITIDDMIGEGLTEELAGRITDVINFGRISEPEMKRIISVKAEETGIEIGYDVRLSENALGEFMDIAYSNLGMRTVINKVRSLTFGAVAEKYFSGALCNDQYYVLIDGKDRSSLVRSEVMVKPDHISC